MEKKKRLKAEHCRQRAKEFIELAQVAKGEADKQPLLKLANTWLDLARRAEELESGKK